MAFAAGLVLWLLAAPAGAADALLPAIAELQVEPDAIVLQGASRQQQLQVTARLENGSLCDVTHQSQMVPSDPRLARLDRGIVFGLADGEGHIEVRVGSQQVRVPLRVRDFAAYPAVHFANDVVPILSKLGCNSGGCHGKASGQNGFKLSVFGFDPEADYNALVKEARGRRVFPASPASSLLLAKPSGRVPHGGGQRLATDSADYELIFQWIKQGLPVGQLDAPTVAEIRVSPPERVLRFGEEQQILATAVYSDGSRRDVTGAAAYAGNASLVAEVDAGGLVRVGQVPGQAAITVNYLGQVAAVAIQVPRPDAPESYPEQPVNNEIDALVWTKLEKMGIVPSELADDATFLRRASLDTIGTLPKPEEARAFLADRATDKRSRWIDKILERPEYADYWALKWADILLVNRDKLGDRGAFEMHRWLRAQFARNRPYDQWVRELITASGNSGTNGPANFYPRRWTRRKMPPGRQPGVSRHSPGVRPVPPSSVREVVAGRFLRPGRLLQRHGAQEVIGADRVLVYHAGYRETRMPLTNRPVATHPLAGGVPANLEQGDPRVKLAQWMTDPANPWFARLASTACGSIISAAAWSSRKTICAPRIRPPTSRCSITWPRQLVAQALRSQIRHAIDPQLARLSAFRRAERDECGRRAELFASLRPTIAG